MSRPEWLPSSTMTVNMHVHETTAFPVRFYAEEDRVTVDITGSGGSVTLFLDRAELARLASVLLHTESELDERTGRVVPNDPTPEGPAVEPVNPAA
ncbi:hypothetical protein [Pseudonocardia alni]|uniref:hypothetical protein n=1 Tax=Pseudonocardia alni TaxID=33907 RepID=UPI0027A40266|nr:hypothetical protein PaSha_08920 [Pseudonocardia alni]